MRCHSLAVGLILVLLLMGPATGAQTHPPETWTIDGHTVLRDQTMEVDGDIAILEGGKLRLEGSHLRVGGKIHVHEGGTLEMLPSSSGGSRLSALPGGPGFWILVDGRVSSHGSPGARISGLWGDGLTAAMPGNEGGLKIHGSAQLEGVLIDSGTAGLFVGQGANVVVQDSMLHGLGEAGLISMGHLRLDGTTIADHEINLLGKDTCDIWIQDSQILNALAEQVLINGCQAVVRHSVLSGGGVGVVANNAANVTVEDTVIEGYNIDGLGSYAGPGPDRSQMLRPTVRFLNVTLVPAPSAQRGADLMGNAMVDFRNVTISHHESHGVQASQAVLSMRDSTFTDNGGYGIQLAGGRFAIDPLAAHNRFDVEGTPNVKGAISHVVIANFHAVRETPGGLTPLQGNLEVVLHSSTDGPIEPIVSRSPGPGSREIWFDAYETAEGVTSDRGPVQYKAFHDSWAGSRKGHVGPTEPVVLLSIETAQTTSWNYVSWTLMLLGVAIMIPPIGSLKVRAALQNRVRRLRKRLKGDASPKR